MTDREEPAMAITEWLKRLRSEDPSVRREAADALGAMGEVAARPEVLQTLTEQLRAEGWDVRSAAARALRGILSPSG